MELMILADFTNVGNQVAGALFAMVGICMVHFMPPHSKLSMPTLTTISCPMFEQQHKVILS